jgi:pyruvate/2-oxoglutarate dehydrogenase complex dihydrolipoamide acyltransferase (E2) component
MVQAIRMPMMGNTMESGHLVEWQVAEGDAVEADDELVLVESEKASNEIVAEQDGVLARVDVTAGEEVPPGTVLGIVAGPDESLDDAPAPRSRIEPDSADESPDTDADAGTDGEAATEAAADTDDGGVGAESATAGGDAPDASGDETDGEAVPTADGHAFASPSTRRLAREHGVSIREVSRTGIGSRVTDSDVRAASGETDRPGATGVEAPDATGGRREARDPGTLGVTIEREQELSSMRRTIADRMSRSSRDAPHVTNKREVAIGDALAAADDLADELDAPIGFTDVLVAAVVRALDRHPEFNAWFEGGRLRFVAERNVAVAVDTDAGLVTPVIREAAGRSIAGIATERRRLTDTVLEGNYTMDDLSGGTFTITNLGMFGVDSFDPIINPPQVSILGVGRIRDDDEGKQCTLSLSFDHRAVDGADAARFLDTIAEGLAAPSVLAAERARLGADAAGSSRLAAGRSAEAPDGVGAAIARDIRERALEIATTHDWPVPEFEVDLRGDRPAVAVTAPDTASPATMKRLTYAACRESSYAGTITELHDPALTVDCG